VVKLKCHKTSIEVIVVPLREGMSWRALYHFNKFYGFFLIKRKICVNSISEIRNNTGKVGLETLKIKENSPSIKN